ncbi:MAG TPA: hypothetical protein VF669_06560 [Tepidisphaeraceae bacterium]|jgi:hypothetical protein
MMNRLVVLFVLLAGVAPAMAVERGTWFYYIASEPNGAANIVGNPQKEDDAIAFMNQWEIKRLYGSYSTLTTSNPQAMAKWNKKLAQAGIKSYVEISGATQAFPSNRSALLSTVDTRLVNFNAARSDPQEKFVGIEMDIEPWTTTEWRNSTTVQRQSMLFDLRNAFSDVRTRASNAGLADAKLSAALPIFFDTTATIAWGPGEVDQWFTDIGKSLNEISVMPYDTADVSTIMRRSSYELEKFPGTTFIALRTRLDLEWSSMQQFTDAMNQIEAQTGRGIDIENYYRLRASVPEPGGVVVCGLLGMTGMLRRRKRN